MGLIYAIIKKDYFISLWTFPYLIFLYIIGWVVHLHWSTLLPLLCIAIGIVFEDLARKMGAGKLRLYPYAIVSSLVIFGLIISISMITNDLNNLYIEQYYFTIHELESHEGDGDKYDSNQDITGVGSHRTCALTWIPMYIFNANVIFRDTDIPYDNFTKPLLTNKFLIVADSNLLGRLTSKDQDQRDILITRLYYNTSEIIASFIDVESERYSFMNIGENHGSGKFVEVRANY